MLHKRRLYNVSFAAAAVLRCSDWVPSELAHSYQHFPADADALSGCIRRLKAAPVCPPTLVGGTCVELAGEKIQ
jgi:hypothetical protein